MAVSDPKVFDDMQLEMVQHEEEGVQVQDLTTTGKDSHLEMECKVEASSSSTKDTVTETFNKNEDKWWKVFPFDKEELQAITDNECYLANTPWTEAVSKLENLYYNSEKYREVLYLVCESDLMERALGENNRRVLRMNYFNGQALRKLVDFLEALEVFQNVEENKLREAMQMYQDILAVRERLLGAEHPIILATKSSIAYTKLQKKEYGEALKEFNDILEIQERVQESNHPEILGNKHFLAVAYYHLGRYKESLQLFKEVNEKLMQNFSQRNPNTISANHLLALLIALLAMVFLIFWN